MRKYFKQTDNTKVKENLERDRFFKFCEEAGADYVEDDEILIYCSGVWKLGKNTKGSLLAIRFDYDNYLRIGTIDEKCDNFDSEEANILSDFQIDKVCRTLQKIKGWKPKIKCTNYYYIS